MKTFSHYARFILAATALTVSSAYADPAHVTWAENLVDHITPDKNEYASNPSYVKWAGVNGATTYENRTQCSSFLTQLLKQTYQWNNTQFSQWFGSSSPSAALYHDEIAAQQDFALVTQAQQIQKGDILAIKYFEEDAEVTGHVMLADDIARAVAPGEPVIDGTTQYELKVIDSSKSGHGNDDTRLLDDKSWDSGVGKGTLRLYVDGGGAVVGYSWSFSKNSVYYGPQSPRHLVIGRLVF